MRCRRLAGGRLVHLFDLGRAGGGERICRSIVWTGSKEVAELKVDQIHSFSEIRADGKKLGPDRRRSLEEAARNMGASGFKLFRTVTFPLMLPGYFAGAIIVFIWAFTDLGTPLVFEYRELISVQIFDLVTDLHQNPMGYAFVVAVIVITLLFFYVSKRLIGGNGYAMLGRGHVASAVRPASLSLTIVIYAVVLGISAVALIPHVGVLLTSITARWFLTVLPTEYTFKFYREIFVLDLTLLSIKNSLFLSSLSTLIDIVLGVTIAYLLSRKRVTGREELDALAMLP